MRKKIKICGISICKNEVKTLRRKYCYLHHNILKHISSRDYVREVVRIRKNYTCQKCKRVWRFGERRFDVHHKKYCGLHSRKVYRIEDLKELQVFCHACHMGLDMVRKKMKGKGTGRNKRSKWKSVYYKK